MAITKLKLREETLTTVPTPLRSKKSLITINTRRMIYLRASPKYKKQKHQSHSTMQMVLLSKPAPNHIKTKRRQNHKYTNQRKTNLRSWAHLRSHSTSSPPSKQMKHTSSSIFFLVGALTPLEILPRFLF